MNLMLAWLNARSERRSGLATGAMIGAMALTLAACSTTPSEPPPPARPVFTSPILANQMVGKWGLAAYHRPQDAARTEAQARAQCSNPYVITNGTNGGVLMYLADDNKLSEVVSKANGGPTFIGLPTEPAGAQTDRQVVRFDGNVMVLKWVDPEVAGRYGTMIYVRCP
ncbi:MAG: hypothetical protein AB7E29_01670 [Xanthobacter sp.]